MHIRPLEKLKVPVPPDHALVLIDPALPRGIPVDDTVKGLLRATHHLANGLFSDGAGFSDKPIGKKI